MKKLGMFLPFEETAVTIKPTATLSLSKFVISYKLQQTVLTGYFL